MSIQSFAITGKVREVDDAIRLSGTSDERVYEVHPELCFTFAGDGAPMRAGKKTSAGRQERIQLLTGFFGGAADRLLTERNKRDVGADDVLDALIALWSAFRIGRGEHTSLPPVPEHDALGNRMAIFY